MDGASAEDSHSRAESPSGIFAKPLADGPNRVEGGTSEKVDTASSYPEVEPPPRSLRRSSSSRRRASASRSAADAPFAAEALPAATPLVYPMLAAWSTLRSSARPRLRMPSSAASSTRNICSEVNDASLVDARALRERGRKGRGSFVGMRPLRRELARARMLWDGRASRERPRAREGWARTSSGRADRREAIERASRKPSRAPRRARRCSGPRARCGTCPKMRARRSRDQSLDAPHPKTCSPARRTWW